MQTEATVFVTVFAQPAQAVVTVVQQTATADYFNYAMLSLTSVSAVAAFVTIFIGIVAVVVAVWARGEYRSFKEWQKRADENMKAAATDAGKQAAIKMLSNRRKEGAEWSQTEKGEKND